MRCSQIGPSLSESVVGSSGLSHPNLLSQGQEMSIKKKGKNANTKKITLKYFIQDFRRHDIG
jgi:hypothetical protein